jgi:lipopolysaccharide/colanic/teichoic acid biosynthesis glycosyltransferase
MSDVLPRTSQTSTSALPGQQRRSARPLIAARPPSELIFREDVSYRRTRRALEVVLASLMLIVAFPIILASSIAILIEDGWPVFFAQRRVGRFGRLFTIYKLRTMRKDSCLDGPAPTARHDPRITGTGCILRRLSIDELPQLVNIIRGDMAFVGPRPEMPFLVRDYAEWQHLRHLVTPGVTGFWQVSGRKTLPMQLPEATLLDLEHVKNASYLTDVRVLVKTACEVVRMSGAF